MFKKPQWIKEIKVLVWDLDGTLYQEIPEMKTAIMTNCIKAVVQARKISFSIAKDLFLKTYKDLSSSTKALMVLGVDKDYVASGQWYKSIQLQHVRQDKKISNLI
jgi:hypothetical protein